MKKKYIKRSDSKDTLRTYTPNTNNATVFPDFSFDTVLSMIDEDPVARGALTHFVDKCMEGDMNIVDRQTLKYRPKEELTLNEKYKFRTEIIRKIFLMGKLFNNVFVEIVRDSKQTKSLNVLDSTSIEPITEHNGDPIKYKSTVDDKDPQSGKAFAEWDKSEITWYKFNDRTTGYAPVDMKALWTNLLTKEYINRYVAWLWQTGQYRILYNFKQASDNDIDEWLAYNKKHDTNFKVPFIMKGEMETKILRDMKEIGDLIKHLKYLDEQTLILMRIPPIDAGIPDASGRSNSDAQNQSIDAHVTSFKKVVEDITNFDLFPKINKASLLLRFAPNNRFSEKQVWENIQIMKSMGISNKAVEEYLGDRGMFFKAKLFEPIPVQMDNPRDKDTMPSRTGKGEGESNQTQDTPTTREDQMRAT